MKKIIISSALLVAFLFLGLPGASVVPVAASTVGAGGAGFNEERYRNPPRHTSTAPKGPQVATLQTVPPVAGVTFQIAGQQFVTGADGSAVVMVPQPGTYDLQVITDTYHDPYRRVEFSRWLSETFQPTRQIHMPTTSPVVQVGLDVYELVGQKFVAPDGSPVDPKRVTQFSIRSLQGDAFTFHDGQPRWIPASRVTRRRSGGLQQVNLLYTVSEVVVDGSNVVNKAQQQFYAQPNSTWSISLLFYSMRVHATDALFGFAQGNALKLELPNGQVQMHPLDSTGSAEVDSLARGEYYFQIVGAKGISPRSPVSLSKDQDLNAKVVSFLDLAVIAGVGMLIALGLLFYGRFSLNRAVGAQRPRPSSGILRDLDVMHENRSDYRKAHGTSMRQRIVAVAISLMLVATASPVKAQGAIAGTSPIPTLAYYYIWFDTSSWNRAKTDYPLLGRYSSDDAAVMRQHIEWAKAAGIDGFIVSWKSTDTLNRRLKQLVDLAEQENFKLVIIYQGLDFNRDPLPVTQVASDLDYFIKNFAGRPAFQLFQKPLVIWSGTWQFSTQDIAQTTQGRRNSLLILASEKNIAGYQRIADSVDGNAYYWSSVNPDTYSGYQDKLAAMAQVVHQHQGLWIPPAAPGFDARLIGGTSIVDRKNGATFRTQINTAMASSPDALGIISWNEFSENSYIEPSKQYGSQYLDILSQVNHLPAPDVPNFDSSLPSGKFPEVIPHSRVIALGGIAAMIIVAFVLISRRSQGVRR